MTISIIIPVYNASLLIVRCLNSVFEQKGDYKLEVICIDDGSTDNSVEIVKNFSHSISIIQQSNQGPAAARNKGIEAATGKYLAFIDADDYWKPKFLFETVSFLESNKNVVAVSVGQKHFISGNSEIIVPSFIETDPSKIPQSVILDNFYAFWAKHFHVCTGSILMRTKVVKQTGGQRVDLKITEDLEFLAYLATFGSIGFIPKVLFVSDGVQVTKQIGWLKKNRKRWSSAPTVNKWEERIVNRILSKDIKFYKIARGRIAKNLCYSMIMSKRSKLAKITSFKYGDSFPKDKVGKLLHKGSKNRLFWLITVIVVYIREYFRIIRVN